MFSTSSGLSLVPISLSPFLTCSNRLCAQCLLRCNRQQNTFCVYLSLNLLMSFLFLPFLCLLFTVQNIFLEGGVRPLLSFYSHSGDTVGGEGGKQESWTPRAQGVGTLWSASQGRWKWWLSKIRRSRRQSGEGMEESSLFIGFGGTWVRGFLGGPGTRVSGGAISLKSVIVVIA